MEKIYIVIVILGLIFALPASDPLEDSDFYPGKITVCFSADLLGNTIGDFEIKEVDGIITTPFNWFNDLSKEYEIISLKQKYRVKDREWNNNGRYPMNIFTIEIKDDNITDRLISALDQYKDILFAEREAIYRTSYTPNDPLINNQWALEMIEAFEAWDIIPGGSEDIIIGIVDSGVKWNHIDLEANMYINTAELPGIQINEETGEISGGDGIDNDGNGFVDDIMGWDFWATEDGGESNNPFQSFGGHYHGTHVAGCAAAVGDNGIRIASPAYNVKLLATKHSPFGVFTPVVYNPYAGIYYLADTGAHIINCSWGGLGGANEANLAVTYAKEHGSLVIAAAGNSGFDSATMKQYPACATDAFSVIATDSNDMIPNWSNYGTHHDISAPGVSIYSTMFNEAGTDIYGPLQGTSMASPIVAGVVALLKSHNPFMTVDELIFYLKAGADPIDHLNDPLYAGKLGSGRVNALNSLILATPLDNDLKTVAIYGDLCTFPNSPLEITIIIQNIGLNTATDYTVNLMQIGNNIPLVTTPGISLIYGEKINYILQWTPENIGEYQLYGQIIWELDQNNSNNQTNLMEVIVLQEGFTNIFIGDDISENFGYIPIDYSHTNSISQTIYLAEELVYGAINQITLKFAGDGSIPIGKIVSLYMTTTDQSSFDSGNDWIQYAQFTKIFSGSLPISVMGIYDVSIPLINPFNYDSGNLVIMATKDDNTWYSANNSFQITNLNQNRSISYSVNAVDPLFKDLLPSGTLMNAIPNINLYIDTSIILKKPENLEASIQDNIIYLSWTAAPPGSTSTFSSYNIYKNNEVVSNTMDLSYSDIIDDIYMIYHYHVTAVYTDPDGESEKSNVITNALYRPINYHSPNAGTEENPFLISNIHNLWWLSEYPIEWWRGDDIHVYFRQTADIDASDTINWNDGGGFRPIGYGDSIFENSFVGVYDGDNHTISNIYQNQNNRFFDGFFSAIRNNSVIKNLTLENLSINKNNPVVFTAMIGGISGVIENSILQNITISGDIHISGTNTMFGGLGGDVTFSSIENCHFVGDITTISSGQGIIGGILGTSYDSTLNECSYTGDISGSANTDVGGIVGRVDNSVLSDNFIISSCVTSGNFIGSFIGGIVGRQVRSKILQSSSSASLTNPYIPAGGDVGGISGYSSMSEIEACFSSSNINVASLRDAGGIIGTINGYTTIDRCYFTGEIVSGAYAGGIAGGAMIYANILNSYSTGSIISGYGTGGIAGTISTGVNISYCYSAGSLQGSAPYSQIGGIVGFISQTGGPQSEITSSFWDIETTGATTYSGNTAGIITNVYGYPTATMQLLQTYTNYGWDFINIWAIEPEINNGYPYLQDHSIIILPPPTNLSAQIVEDLIFLTWDGTEGAVNYNIYRNEDIIFSTTESEYYDNDVTLGIEYSYYVTAVYIDPDGESLPSNMVIITIPLNELEYYILPPKTELVGNYPNPFNPETTISFSINVASILRIDIYNIKGQKVKSLFNDYKPAGSHNIIWNGKDDDGLDVGSGIYLYKMEVGEYSAVRRMLLIK